MSTWTTEKTNGYKMQELRREASDRNLVGEARGSRATGSGVGQRLSVWCGTGLIAIGSRLVRPTLVARAHPGA